ncbi:MAG: hypothetical protein NC112_08890 [Oxalobacter formigenes]|nr:hypothetical protein [Oxalobacter formigenes]
MSCAFSLCPFLPDSLPDAPVKAGCVALAKGLDGDAMPFPFEALFGKEALLGEALPDSAQSAAAFFAVPAPVFLCDEVTSTFAVGHRLAQQGLLPSWGAVLAASQTAGRGQFRRHWQSPRGNLYATFRLPDSALFRSDAAAVATGVLLAAALSRLGYPLRLKWPNDLLNREEAKAAGILIEEKDGVRLAGVGVNLRVLPDAGLLRRERAVPAGLLLSANGEPFLQSPFAFWQTLVKELIFAYSQSFAQLAAETLPDLADAFLAWKGEAVTVSDHNGILLNGWLRGVGPRGGALVETGKGSVCEIFGGSLARG